MKKIMELYMVIFMMIVASSHLTMADEKVQYHYEKGSYFDTDIAGKVLQRSFSIIPSDLYNIVATPFRYPGTTLKYLGLMEGLIALDKPLTTFYQRHIEKPLDIYSLPTLIYDSSITHGADSWLVFGNIGYYLAGFALGDEKSQITAIMAMKAMTYSFFFDHVFLKAITGRKRPKHDLYHCQDPNPSTSCDPHDFKLFQSPQIRSAYDRTAMPSFHLTMYFSMAKVYQEMYDDYWLPYGALALIFASNIKGHHHWVSDMVAGGIIGTLIGHQVVSNYRNQYYQKKPSDFQITPLENGMEFSYRF